MRIIQIGAAAVVLCATAQTKAANISNSAIKGTYAFRMSGATSFAPFYDGSAGKTNSGVATAPRQDVLRVGVFKTDGKGGLTGRTIATTDDGLSTVVIDFNWTGTYAVSTNGDGTGTMTINAPTAANINSCMSGDGAPLSGCEAYEGTETYAFVVSGSKQEHTLNLIETDNAGGGAKIFMHGTATLQIPKKGGGGGGGIGFPF